MKIVSFTVIGNEEEIIESFVRYNIQFLDQMIFISSCCIDNTLKIIHELMREGINVRLFLEEDINFDQMYLDNKYMKKIANETGADFIIPLDADEFLSGNQNPRTIIENLDTDYVYSVCWKNYTMSPTYDCTEFFIPKRLTHINKKIEGKIKKVILPGEIIRSNHVMLATGHHRVIGAGVQHRSLDELWLAHYPTTSREQYLLKIYIKSIQAPTLRSFSFDEGVHMFTQMAQLKSGVDIFRAAGGYGIEGDMNVEVEYAPLNLSYCNAEKLRIRYGELVGLDWIDAIRKFGRLMALRSYILETNQERLAKRPDILIFGTGKYMQYIMKKIPAGLVNIKAYIDNDPERQFRMWERKLIICPEYIRFFEYDKVIILSELYYSEMMETLLELGVPKEKICGAWYFMDLLDEGA